MSKRILVVDDEIDTLRLLKTILEISGYEAYTTLNSLEALTLAQVEQPDVVLLDIMMPKLDGFQLCKMMRAHPTTQLLPIIFVTAYDALDLEDRRRSSGGDMVLHKPINMDSLIQAIEVVEKLERNIPDDIRTASEGIAPVNGKGTSVVPESNGKPHDPTINPPNPHPPSV
ncbi:MAG: response regulator [Anaerolineae bacterium]|nr:MAG: response regulator [Anaerolineae bacterium]